MERKIGEIFTYEDKRYQVVKVDFGIGCIGCTFKTSGCSKYKSLLGHCSYIFRHDKTSVIFKLINNNMEIKNNQLTIDIPEGMEIDTENSSLAEGIIKFKSKCITYSKIINSFNSITNTNVYIHSSDTKTLKEVLTKEVVKALNEEASIYMNYEIPEVKLAGNPPSGKENRRTRRRSELRKKKGRL